MALLLIMRAYPHVDRNCRKVELYDMAWRDVDLSMYIIAAAPYAGPIGVQAVYHWNAALSPEDQFAGCPSQPAYPSPQKLCIVVQPCFGLWLCLGQTNSS